MAVSISGSGTMTGLVPGGLPDGCVTASDLAPGVLPTVATRTDINGIHTTGTITSGTTSLTVASATGISQGMVVVGEGITPGTTVASISGTTVTLSANAGATLSSDPVGFYDNTKALSPGSVGGQLCRAWVNFDGTTSPINIRASYNVSSITDNGVGDYTVNFTTAMPDANYAVMPISKYNNYGSMPGSGAYAMVTELARASNALQVGSVRIWCTYVLDQYLYDRETVTVTIFR